jgi:tetratricopeptide (TPR) repeat protein
MSLSSRGSRIAVAAAAAIVIFVALTLLMRTKDSSARATGQAETQPVAADAGAEKRHEAKSLEAELQKKPNHVPILFRLAQLARDNGQHAEAAAHLRKIVELEPKNTEARLELGRNLYDAGDITGALEQTNRILTDDPKNVDALYNIGAIYANSDKADVAREYWTRAVASAPDSESGKRASEGLKRLGALAR